YGVAALVALVFVLGDEAGAKAGLAFELGLIALGVGTGALFIGGFFIYALAIRTAGMALASGVMRLAVVLPFLASWGIWGEVPTAGQLVGLALAGVAFLLIARPPPGSQAAQTATVQAQRGAAGILVLLFVAGGLGDVAMKTFTEVYGATHSSALFGLFLFAVAFLIGLGIAGAHAWRTGRRPTRAELGWGTALGVVNYGSVAFIIGALEALDGTFVFPFNNIAIVVGAAVLGIVVWRERLARVNVIGLGLAALALVLLTL
ncbi:MAG: hypothetical protein AAGG50_17070, partial [Bacteroidota bacterium]